MPWELRPDGKTLLKHSGREPDPKRPGKTRPRPYRKVIDTQDKRKIVRAYDQWLCELEGSLTDQRLSDLTALYRQKHGEKFGSYIGRLDAELGSVLVDDKRFPLEWDRFVARLSMDTYKGPGWETEKKRSAATLNKYKAACRAVLRCGWASGRIDEIPIRDWGMGEAEARSRVLDADEELRLLNTMRTEGSWLYHAVRFALRNPIRAEDLFTLPKTALDETVPWVSFFPGKTSKQKKPTCLPELDDEDLAYFARLPANCPLLFPKLIAWGGWVPAPGYKKHWETITRHAKLGDFRFHDLRHCATKYLLDNGYSSDDLRRLQIHGTAEMIRRYDNADQRKVVESVARRRAFVECREARNG